MISLYSVNFDENESSCGNENEEERYLQKFISQERLERINSLKFDADKKTLLYSELLVKLVAAHWLGGSALQLHVSHDALGRPYIFGHEYFSFSVAHTRSFLVVVVGRSALGVDVEELNTPLQSISSVISNFTENEQNFIKESDDQISAFLKVWTRKEAFLKASGIGLYGKLNTFDVLDNRQYWSSQDDRKVISLFARDKSELQRINKVDIDIHKIREIYFQLDC